MNQHIHLLAATKCKSAYLSTRFHRSDDEHEDDVNGWRAAGCAVRPCRRRGHISDGGKECGTSRKAAPSAAVKNIDFLILMFFIPQVCT